MCEGESEAACVKGKGGCMCEGEGEAACVKGKGETESCGFKSTYPFFRIL